MHADMAEVWRLPLPDDLWPLSLSPRQAGLSPRFSNMSLSPHGSGLWLPLSPGGCHTQSFF